MPKLKIESPQVKIHGKIPKNLFAHIESEIIIQDLSPKNKNLRLSAHLHWKIINKRKYNKIEKLRKFNFGFKKFLPFLKVFL